MSEAKEGCAWLEDVEESTFIRFSQFAYTGDYIAADPEILLDSSTIAFTPSKPNSDEPVAVVVEELPHHPDPTIAHPYVEAEQTIDEDPFSAHIWTPRPSTKKKSKVKGPPTGLAPGWNESPDTGEGVSSSRREKLWKLFESEDGMKVRRHRKLSSPPFHPRKNLETCEDYKDVFLCHARLYVFAEKYDIAPLKELSLNKLHKTLSVFTLYKERVGDIVDLMRYSYANTVHRSPSDDPLRSLVIHYAACEVENLVPNSEFKALLEEPGELASDLVVKMINRLD